MSSTPNCPQCGSSNTVDACFEEGCPTFKNAGPAVTPVPLRSEGAEMIRRERLRQIRVEGWTPEHDDQWQNSELIRAALRYAQLAAIQCGFTGRIISSTPEDWPWDVEWWKPSDDPKVNLKKAGALLAAAIDLEKRRGAT